MLLCLLHRWMGWAWAAAMGLRLQLTTVLAVVLRMGMVHQAEGVFAMASRRPEVPLTEMDVEDHLMVVVVVVIVMAVLHLLEIGTIGKDKGQGVLSDALVEIDAGDIREPCPSLAIPLFVYLVGYTTTRSILPHPEPLLE
jgi:C4-dicarboxylate transporter